MSTLGRREFLAGMGGMGVGLGLGALSHWLPLSSPEVGPDWSAGKEEFVSSTCMLCPSHCGIRGRIVDGKLVRIDGNPLHPISRGGLCPKGPAGIQLLYHPGRITGPIERVGPPGSDQFQRVSWDEALDRVGKVLAQIRGEGNASSVAWLSGDVSGIMADLLRRFARVYGTPHDLREDYADGSAEVMKTTQGIDAPPAFDLADADLVLSFGAALSEAWWCLPQAARARDGAAGSRPRWIQIDVRHSRTAARANEWVPIRPGTYGALALGLAYVILKEGLYDASKIKDQVLGLEDWADESGKTIPGFRTLVLKHGRTADISARTGVPAETLVRLAKTFGRMRRPVALWDQSVSWRTGGYSDALAIHALNVLVGALNRPGGVLAQPPLPAPSFKNLPVEQNGSVVVPPPPIFTPGNWAARITSQSPSPVNALFLYYANPVASSPEPAEVIAALERIPLVVSFSPFLDESAKHADLVLPDHTYLERWQDAPAPPSVPIPVWGLVQPMVPPLHETRATGDVLLDLTTRLGGGVASAFPWTKVEDLVKEKGEALATVNHGGTFVSALRREELRDLQARGWWLPHRQSKGQFWDSITTSGGWFDPFYDYHDRSALSHLPGGKVQLFPAEARQHITSSIPGLKEGFLPLEQVPGSRARDEMYPLLLVPFRVMTLASGGTTLMPWLLENLGILTGDAWETWAEINPETGHELGLLNGQMVRVESASGVLQARLRFFVGAQPGVVNVPYGLHTMVEGWGQAAGGNPLNVTGSRRDPSTELPDWYSAHVRVVPA